MKYEKQTEYWFQDVAANWRHVMILRRLFYARFDAYRSQLIRVLATLWQKAIRWISQRNVTTKVYNWTASNKDREFYTWADWPQRTSFPSENIMIKKIAPFSCDSKMLSARRLRHFKSKHAVFCRFRCHQAVGPVDAKEASKLHQWSVSSHEFIDIKSHDYKCGFARLQCCKSSQLQYIEKMVLKRPWPV